MLQGKTYKQWFKTRAIKNAHSHYYNTGAEVKSNEIIDFMFDRLDDDQGGTLDFNEITKLFKSNGINMTTNQVANMFGEAKREDACSIFRKNMQNGMFNKADLRAIQKKTTKYNLSQVMRPEQWKNVTKSPAALKCKF